MQLRELQSNELFRDIRKKQFTLNSQQKLAFRQLFRRHHNPNFLNQQFHRIVTLGVPTEFRCWVWCSLIPNHYNISDSFYNTILQHLAQQQSLHKHQKQQQMRREEEAAPSLNNSWCMDTSVDVVQTELPLSMNPAGKKRIFGALKNIELDLPRTFPQLKILHSDPQQYQKLTRILGSFSIIREDIGYIQGMSQIAVLLLQQMGSQLYAFIGLTTLMTSTTLNDFFTFKEENTQNICEGIKQTIRKLSPELYQVLAQYQIDPKIYVINWIMTMFTRIFHMDSILMIWDIVLVNSVSRTVLQELCAAIVVSRRTAILNCKSPSKIVKLLLHSKLDICQGDWVLEYMRSLVRSA